MHVGSSNGTAHLLGQKSGEETHTLSAAEMPQHNHVLNGSNDAANTGLPANTRMLAQTPTTTGPIYSDSGANLNQALASGTVANVGGGQAHNNMQPYLAINFVIALRGLFPSRN